MKQMDFRELFKKAVFEGYGVHENLEIIEERVSHLRTGAAITYKDLENIADDDLWPFNKFWKWPPEDKIESALKETGGILEKLKDDFTYNEKEALIKFNAIFKSISLVSILLRFIFPEHYGIYSRPVLHISGTERGRNEVDEYLNYLGVLRSILDIVEMRERYGVERVADVDMLLLAISKLNGDYLDEFNSLYTRGYLPSETYLIEVSHEFSKSVEKSDQTTKGRILGAIIRLSKEPCVSIGDTLKPLLDDKGRWRFRIGDYRLIYLPQKGKKIVSLLDFGSRGDIYKQ
jgi:mRNA-degrading endonuclease RelE of RelBE toxin-antitoxin system